MKQEKNIWEQSRVELFQKLDCRETGLSQEDAALRLLKYGANELHAGKQKSVWQIFLGQFADFLVLILILAAVISACMGDVESMIVILAVITMNAILGTVQTVKASASLDSLKQMSAPTAKVLRDGQIVQIPGREVVPGDVVILEAGDSVCADGRLLECASLKCAESALTGESLPVEKDTEPLSGETALGDRKNMVFSGSFVTYGRGRFLVTATGMDTEMGKIAQLLKNTEERKTPLQVSLDQFGRKLSIIILVICAVLFGVSVLWRHENVMNAFLFAVALAVAAIPEALSSIVTIVLSFGTQKMAREHAIIRKLQAVGGLGSVSVICSDKTGTLTQNKMTVVDHHGADLSRLALAMELFTDGSLNTFAKPTNVDTDSRILCYDIRDLGKQLQPVGMLVVLDSIFNRIIRNRALGKNTWLYVDEIYLLFQHEYSANFLFTLWKRVRKYGACATGITQNIDDLLQSHIARTMLANSEFLVMLNQAATDRAELAKLLNISDNQLSYITNVESGRGLIKCGSAIVPFMDSFPRGTKLYQMMTTRPADRDMAA